MRPSNSLILLAGQRPVRLREQTHGRRRRRAHAQGAGRPRSEGRPKMPASRPATATPIAAYRKFLETAPQARAAHRGHAPPRRPGDGRRRQPARPAAAVDQRPTTGPPIARYQDFLKAYPKDPGNDRVLYQLARAHEQGGELEIALKTLDRLVAELPEDALPRRGAVPPRRAAVHHARLRQGRAGLRHRDEGRLGQPVPRALAVHAGLVAVQAGPARRRAAVVLRRARPQAGRPWRPWRRARSASPA